MRALRKMTAPGYTKCGSQQTEILKPETSDEDIAMDCFSVHQFLLLLLRSHDS